MVLPTGRTAVVRGTMFALALFLVSSSAEAQPRITTSAQPAVGFIGGGSIDPEQVFAGVFWQSPALGGRFHLRPGIDGGFGSDLRLGTINIDFVVRFPLGASGWHLVQGGGPVIVLTRIADIDDTDISAGGSYIIGFSHDNGFFTEFRIGGGNIPSLKIGAGYQLKF